MEDYLSLQLDPGGYVSLTSRVKWQVGSMGAAVLGLCMVGDGPSLPNDVDVFVRLVTTPRRATFTFIRQPHRTTDAS